MGILFLIAFFIVSFFIVILVLLQEGKGGGLTGMSTGMDGVMGVKNPLRRGTAWLFVVFVCMALFINWYFHYGTDRALPTGANLPASEVRTLQESIPSPDIIVTEPVPEGALRPDEEPVETPVESVRPDGGEASPDDGQPGETAAEATENAVVETPTTGEDVSEAAADLRPDEPPDAVEEPQSLTPPSAD